MQETFNLTKNINRFDSRYRIQGGEWHLAAPVLLIGLGLALRLFQLDAKSLRLDESYNYGTVTGVSSWDLLTGQVYRSGHPPFFFLAWHQWIKYLGNDEFVLRLPMALAGTAQVAAIYLAGLKMFNRRVACIAAVGVAISPFLVSYSQEAGVYSTFTAAAALMLALFWQALLSPKISHWLWFGLAALLTLYVHLFTLLLFAVEPLIILPLLLYRQPYQNKRGLKGQLVRGWLLSIGLRGLALLLIIPTLANVAQQPTANPLPFVSLPQIFYKLLKTYTYRLPTLIDNHTLPEILPDIVALLLLIIGTFPALKFLAQWFGGKNTLLDDKAGNEGFACYALGWWLILPPILIFGVSLLVHAFAEPYFIFGTNFFWLLLANGLLILWQKWSYVGKIGAGFLSLVLLVSMVWWLAYVYFDPRLDREPWRAAGEFLAQQASPGDVLVLEPDYDYKSVSYYYLGYLPLPTFLMGTPYSPAKAQELLTQTLKYHPPHIWLIFRHDDQDVLSMGYLRLELDKTRPIVQTWQQNLLEVREYQVK